MQTFIKAIAGALIALVLILVLDKQDKHIGILLALAVSCMVLAGCVQFLDPILAFAGHIQKIASLDTELLSVIIKAVGIGFLGEIASLICIDAGNAAIGKALQYLTTVIILWLSIPLFNTLIELVEKIMVDI